MPIHNSCITKPQSKGHIIFLLHVEIYRCLRSHIYGCIAALYSSSSTASSFQMQQTYKTMSLYQGCVCMLWICAGTCQFSLYSPELLFVFLNMYNINYYSLRHDSTHWNSLVEITGSVYFCVDLAQFQPQLKPNTFGNWSPDLYGCYLQYQ